MRKQTFALTWVNKCQVAIYIGHLKCKLVSEMDKQGEKYGLRQLVMRDRKVGGESELALELHDLGIVGSQSCKIHWCSEA